MENLYCNIYNRYAYLRFYPCYVQNFTIDVVSVGLLLYTLHIACIHFKALYATLIYMRYPFNLRKQITQNFGQQHAALVGGTHTGTDYAMPSNTPLFAMSSGTVYYVGYDKISGNYLLVNSGNIQYGYFHLSKVLVAGGQVVKEGQEIARSGATGAVTGPHLHLQVKINGTLSDPEALLNSGASTAPVTPPSAPTGEMYTIKAGDTFWGLEEAWGLSHGTLQNLNPGVNATSLQIGQNIRVKAATSAPAQTGAEYTTVTPGFTMWAFENAHGIPFGTLQNLNPGVNPKLLQVGQRLRVK